MTRQLAVTGGQWKGLIQWAVVVIGAGVVLTIGGSLRSYLGVERLGEVMAFCGFVLFLVARIRLARSNR